MFVSVAGRLEYWLLNVWAYNKTLHQYINKITYLRQVRVSIYFIIEEALMLSKIVHSG